MNSTDNALSEYFKIIRQFLKYHAGEGDVVSARQAVEAITPAAVQGDVNMEIYRNDCPDGIEAEQRKALILEWHRRLRDILATKADKGSVDAAKSLMNLYVEDCPEDANTEEGLVTARKWYDRWIDILAAKAAKGNFVDKMNLADILLYADGVPEVLLDCFSDEDDERKL